jgi:hypothetical protein
VSKYVAQTSHLPLHFREEEVGSDHTEQRSTSPDETTLSTEIGSRRIKHVGSDCSLMKISEMSERSSRYIDAKTYGKCKGC